MKPGSCCLLLCLACTLLQSSASAQAATYPVRIGSTNNQIVLTVGNQSKTTSAQSVEVRGAHVPKALTLSPGSQKIKLVQAGSDADCMFTFSVGREARPAALDTLELEISGPTGVLAKKSFILKYVGPESYALRQNYPNPFNPQTTVSYDLAGDARVKLTVYDILGREVRSLVDEVQGAGCYDLQFDAHGLASGVYIYVIAAEPAAGGKGFTAVKKMMVLK